MLQFIYVLEATTNYKSYHIILKALRRTGNEYNYNTLKR